MKAVRELSLTPPMERDCPLVAEEENGLSLGPKKEAIKLRDLVVNTVME